jgi:hypothetical protein
MKAHTSAEETTNTPHHAGMERAYQRIQYGLLQSRSASRVCACSNCANRWAKAQPIRTQSEGPLAGYPIGKSDDW